MNIKKEEKYGGGYFFVKSLLWIAIFSALMAAISIVVSLILIDFIHGNPNRSKSNAGLMMVLFPFLIGVIAIIGVFIVFSPSQFIQGLMARILYPRFGRYSYIFIGLAIPLISIVTWYCYDYLTPTNFNIGINEGADWVPYRNGITLKRYLLALACQGVVTAFSILYFDAGVRNRSKKPVLLGILVLAIIVGATLGHREAIAQYQFIDHPSQ
ncbi:hypothetical protein [Pandoraea sp. ISTKB]|uniref:hypothetical protein n=1 Tax=Pandoraea sp. ISTKB TaxID=1586708 RepID=UPI000846C91B|nr:hypothetical protein [Pandoraea sp. ISTKB]ODP32708.1 hypothetical protein A9762_21425 [Pandoraea sp. ISTKB]